MASAGLVNYRSESVTTRLGKIADHYSELEIVLSDLESRMPPEPSEVPASPGTLSAPIAPKPR
jgi:hypothetical protein